jgi:RNA polymerase sigma factor (sigma-70 family)
MPDLQIVWQPSVFAQYSAGITLTGALARGGGGEHERHPSPPRRATPRPSTRSTPGSTQSTLSNHCLTPPPSYDNHYWREEREALVNCAVWQAARTYRAEMGISREAFALLCAKRAIYAEWQRLCERDRMVVRTPVDTETGEEVEFEDGDALEAIEENLLRGQVQEALMRLSPEERQLLEWHFGEEASEREIAKRLGKSKTWVHKQLEAIIGRLRSFLLGDSNEDSEKRDGFE